MALRDRSFTDLVQRMAEVLESSPAPLLALRKGPVPVETRAALRAKRRSRRKA